MKKLLNNNLEIFINVKNALQASFIIFTVAGFLFLSYMDMSRTKGTISGSPENTHINKIPLSLEIDRSEY